MFIGMQKNDLKSYHDQRDKMIKIIKVAYLTQKWVRVTMWVSLLLVSLLFFRLTGGFPPHGWSVLAQAVTNLPELWSIRGPAVLLPLFVLSTYSLTLLLVWMFLVSTLFWLIMQQWNYLKTWRRVEQAAQSIQHDSWTPTRKESQPTSVLGRTDAREVPHSTSTHSPVPTMFEAAGTRAGIVGTGDVVRMGGVPRGRPSSFENTRSQTLHQQSPVLPVPPAVSQPVLPVSRNVRTVNLNPPLSPSLEQALQTQGGVGIMTGPLTQPFMPRTPITEPQQNAPNSVALRVGTGLDPGITRKEKPNEDHLLAVHGTHTFNADYRPYGLFVVADGMGGHANGQEASRLVIQHIRNAIIPTLLSNVDLDSKHSKELLLEGIQHANLAIYQQNRQQGSDMGSTITAAILVGSMLTVANVGDSRTYLYNPQKGLTQVTHDHSMVARLVEKGIIGADDIYTHPQRNQIYRCLGETASVQIDAFSLAYQPGDTLLLCSDGLWEMVRDVRIQEILRNTLPDASQATQLLVQAALEGGGKDNISAIVVHRD